ncbi:MAG: hypothetical protein ABW215_06605, partial [Kibdelosporangium sp.]
MLRRHATGGLGALVGAALLAVPAGTPFAVAAQPAAGTTDVTITLTMDFFERFEVPDSGIDEEGEFFPEIQIGSSGAVQRRNVVSDDAFHPKNLSPDPWVFTQAVALPQGVTTVPVLVRIWDEDGGLGFGDDRMDISPQDSDVELNLTFDILTETWTGDGITHGVVPGTPCRDRQGAPQGQACATGDGEDGVPEDGDGKRAQLGLSITAGNHSDSDQDGLSDRDERYGVRNRDNSMAVDLPGFGANPHHKDLFLELDYSAGTAPSHQAVEAVRRAFALAPVANPAGGDGITLRVDSGGLHDKTAMEGPPAGTCDDNVDNDGMTGRDGADPDCADRDLGVENFVANCDDGDDDDLDGRTDKDDPDCVVGENLGGGNQVPALANCGFDAPFFRTKAAPGNNYAAVRQRVFNYVIYTTPDTDTDGGGPDTGCGIGGQGSGTDIVLYRRDAGALMHELGHNLGLLDGGHEVHTCKPNHVSVMNYDMSDGIPRNGGGAVVDLSPARTDLNSSTKRGKAPLDQLTENDLYENRVLDPTDTVNNFVFADGAGNKRTVPLNTTPDWNGDNPAGSGDDGDQRQTVNIDDAGPTACENDTTDSEINGHDDWKVVQAHLPRRFPAPGAVVPIEPPTFPTEQEATRILEARNTTDLAVTITDTPDPVAAGESLTWTVTVSNNGPNSATSTQIITTLPGDVTDPTASVPCTIGSATATCNLNELRPGTTS